MFRSVRPDDLSAEEFEIIGLLVGVLDLAAEVSGGECLYAVDGEAVFDLIVTINASLFEWVIENLAKNAVDAMGKSNKVCPNCGRKMKQQFIGLQHCKCGMKLKIGRAHV